MKELHSEQVQAQCVVGPCVFTSDGDQIKQQVASFFSSIVEKQGNSLLSINNKILAVLFGFLIDVFFMHIAKTTLLGQKMIFWS